MSVVQTSFDMWYISRCMGYISRVLSVSHIQVNLDGIVTTAAQIKEFHKIASRASSVNFVQIRTRLYSLNR